MLFLAVIENLNVPVDLGVPESVALPAPLLVKVTPEGRAPVSLSVGVG